MDSPPKLQRVMIPVPMLENGTEDFEENLVGAAVTDIPSVFKEVYKAQKCHADEITKRKQTLKSYQEKLDQVLELKREIEEESVCVTNRIFLAKESIKDKNKAVKELDAALRTLTEEIVDKETDVELLEEDIKAEKRKQDNRRGGLQQFVSDLEQYESKKPLGQAIVQVRERIANLQQRTTHTWTCCTLTDCHLHNNIPVHALKCQVETSFVEQILDKDKEEKENILSGKTQAAMIADIDSMKQKLKLLCQDQNHMASMIEKEKEKQTKIGQDIQVLGKKNAAQMTRRKRQLREIQTKNRQAQIQVTQLETKISQESELLDIQTSTPM